MAPLSLAQFFILRISFNCLIDQLFIPNCHFKSEQGLHLILCVWRFSALVFKVLTTIVLDEPQIRELGPHVTLDSMETASKRSDLSGQLGGEDRLLVAQRRRRMAAVY